MTMGAGNDGPTGQGSRLEAGSVWTGTGGDGSLRWVAADLLAPVDEARLRMDLGPLATLAFAQTVVVSTMLLRSTTKRAEQMDVEVRGDGTLGRVLAEVRADGSFRGLVQNPHAAVEGDGSLDLAKGLGRGLLKVRRVDRQRGGAYESNVGLVQGELALDIAHYLEQSEQRQAAVLLATQVDSTGLTCCRGFLVEALPGADSALVSEVESRIRALPALSDWTRSHSPISGLEQLIPGALLLQAETCMIYACRCSRDSLAETLRQMDAASLDEVFGDDLVLTADCAYCGDQYRFERGELRAPN